MIDPQFFDMVGQNTTRAQRKVPTSWKWAAAGIVCCVIATWLFFGSH